jgi:hypothetical protein
VACLFHHGEPCLTNESQSHLVICPTKLGTDNRHRGDRSPGSRRTVRRCIFDDAGIRDWLVLPVIRFVLVGSHDILYLQGGVSLSVVDRRWTRSDRRPSLAASARPICPYICSDASYCCGPSSSPSPCCGSSWNLFSWLSESLSVSAKTYKISCEYSSLQRQDSSPLNLLRNTCSVRVSLRILTRAAILESRR